MSYVRNTESQQVDVVQMAGTAMQDAINAWRYNPFGSAVAPAAKGSSDGSHDCRCTARATEGYIKESKPVMGVYVPTEEGETLVNEVVRGGGVTVVGTGRKKSSRQCNHQKVPVVNLW